MTHHTIRQTSSTWLTTYLYITDKVSNLSLLYHGYTYLVSKVNVYFDISLQIRNSRYIYNKTTYSCFECYIFIDSVASAWKHMNGSQNMIQFSLNCDKFVLNRLCNELFIIYINIVHSCTSCFFIHLQTYIISFIWYQIGNLTFYDRYRSHSVMIQCVRIRWLTYNKIFI